MQIKHIIAAIEEIAPPALQENWDNSGLQVGDPSAECSGILVCLDPTEAVVAEAAERGCNLVVSHHPLLFRGIKRLSGTTPVERCVVAAIKNGIAIYSAHTSLDSAEGGVSYAMATMLGARVQRVLHTADNSLLELTVYTPRDKADEVRAALSDASLATDAPVMMSETDRTSDAIGSDSDGLPILEITHTPLTALTIELPSHRRREAEIALAGMGAAVSWSFKKLEEADPRTGLGVVAEFPEPLDTHAFIDRVKSAFGIPVVRCTALPPDGEKISRIAMCGGAGGEFISDAVRAGVQAYISADIRYHDFGEWADRIFIVDAGHAETESCTKMLFVQHIKEKFANFAVYISATEKNPINYL